MISESESDSSGFPGALAGRYKLTPESFELHLDAIAATGSNVYSGAEDWQSGPLLLTFDDGGISALEIAAAVERRGWRAHFFVVTSLLGEDGFLSAAQVRDLANRGHVIGSHSHSHPTYMARLPIAELDHEWSHSRQVLTEVLGAPPICAAVPGGFYSDEVAMAASRAGYSRLFNSNPDDRVRRVAGIEVSGRWAIWSSTPAKVAADYTRPRSWSRKRLAIEWRAKHAAKSLSPGLYDVLRRVRARAS